MESHTVVRSPDIGNHTSASFHHHNSYNLALSRTSCPGTGERHRTGGCCHPHPHRRWNVFHCGTRSISTYTPGHRPFQGNHKNCMVSAQLPACSGRRSWFPRQSYRCPHKTRYCDAYCNCRDILLISIPQSQDQKFWGKLIY